MQTSRLAKTQMKRKRKSLNGRLNLNLVLVHLTALNQFYLTQITVALSDNPI